MKKLILLLILSFILADYSFGQERVHSVITTFSYGAYALSDGDETVEGRKFSLGIKMPFSDNWSYIADISRADATGEHTNNDQKKVDISSNSTSVSGGIQWQIQVEKSFIPFISAGISIQRYEFDFDYDDSETGETSGIGYGPVFSIGSKIKIGKRVSIIPSYYYSSMFYETEKNRNRTATSSGLLLAFLVGF